MYKKNILKGEKWNGNISFVIYYGEIKMIN